MPGVVECAALPAAPPLTAMCRAAPINSRRRRACMSEDKTKE